MWCFQSEMSAVGGRERRWGGNGGEAPARGFSSGLDWFRETRKRQSKLGIGEAILVSRNHFMRKLGATVTSACPIRWDGLPLITERLSC